MIAEAEFHPPPRRTAPATESIFGVGELLQGCEREAARMLNGVLAARSEGQEGTAQGTRTAVVPLFWVCLEGVCSFSSSEAAVNAGSRRESRYLTSVVLPCSFHHRRSPLPRFGKGCTLRAAPPEKRAPAYRCTERGKTNFGDPFSQPLSSACRERLWGAEGNGVGKGGGHARKSKRPRFPTVL